MPAHTVLNMVLSQTTEAFHLLSYEFLRIMEGGQAARHNTRDSWSDAYAGLFVSQPFWFPIP